MNTNNNIEFEDDELKGMAPHLFKMKNGNPFRADADYFDNFNSKLQSKINTFEEIKTDAPVLSNIPIYNPFEVPKDYFEDFPTIIQQRVIGSKQSTSIIEWLLLLVKPRVTVPVLITLLLAVLGINFMNNTSLSTKNEVADEVTTEELLYNIDEGTIIESLAKQNNKTENISTEDTEIKNYLINNNIEDTNLKTDQ